jgi:hypothetical protein
MLLILSWMSISFIDSGNILRRFKVCYGLQQETEIFMNAGQVSFNTFN